MKKIIAAAAAGVMLAFSATGAASAARYEPTTETNVKTGTDGKVEPGKKERIVVRLGVPGDAAQCTGTVTLIYKNGKRVLRERDKAPGERVPFNAKVPAPTTKIIALYQRGKKDPCDKSKKVIRL